ncbi:MAG: hypothetical protein KDA27_22985 [Candidatus Eisenbacteria bacterium]|uniref:Uncharacterized protein n=1 Tax=Eiseniibacteriota bacterium TaxID=2212470 RepID=A0A956SFE6_UNCEI|nr:hypothetical protein [Candidatus Eisenbacteria bacterium]MCB9463543.1 hypothetical protein [Candidatus Eisenbacteria bacterium]
MQGYVPQSPDTDPDAERIQIERLREMTYADRFALLESLVQMSDQLSRAGIRLRYPDADEREIGLRAAALRLPPEVMRSVYGWDPDREGL